METNTGTRPTRPPLTRDSRNRVIGGVCGGLARTLGVDPWLVRVLFIVSLALPGPGLLVYVVLWVVLPLDRARTAPTSFDEGGPRPA